MPSLPPLLAGYRLLTRCAAPLLPFYFSARERRGKEDGARIGERFGISTLVRPEGPLVWLHGASVGETLSVLPLARRIVETGRAILITSGTLTSARLVAERAGPGVFHQFLPADTPVAVTRFFDHWRPDLAAFVESELWPNLLVEAQERSIPCGILNARMSARSAARWRKVPTSAGRLLGPLAFCLAQDEASAENYRSLGAGGVTLGGNLKFDAPLPPDDPAERARLAQAIGLRPVLLAASTHPGEEEVIAAAVAEARKSLPDLLLVLVPRHPSRGDGVARLLNARGEKVAQRGKGAMPDRNSTVYLADTLGELGLFYRLATLAFVGGSLVPHGGQNPIEPAKLGVPILMGPHAFNFTAVCRALMEAGGLLSVEDGAALTQTIVALVPDEGRRNAVGRRAQDCAAAGEGAIERSLAALAPFLPAVPA